MTNKCSLFYQDYKNFEQRFMISQGYKACVFEKIISHLQNEQGRFEFLVKWKKAATSWEPYESLVSVQSSVQEYLREKELIIHEKWNRFNQRQILIQKNIQLAHIQSENTFQLTKENRKVTVPIQQSQTSNFYLQYDQFFSPKPIETQNILPKINSSSIFACFKKLNTGINISKINKARQIKKINQGQINQKWMVELQLLNEQNNMITEWIERDILRLMNPFILMDLYTRIEAQQKRNYYTNYEAIETEDQIFEQKSYKKQSKYSQMNLDQEIDQSSYKRSINQISVIQID